MADGATPQEIAKAWSSQGRDAKSPLDYKIINGSSEQAQANPNAETNKLSSVATEQFASESAFDTARALGNVAANRTDMQDAEKSRIAEIRKKISDMFRPRQKTPQAV
jgi:hypothetical protein